ncbi:MAG: zf-HC2 domain-containing protein [Phycisphaerales bacterium]|nr:MAG: zf-HC2 domain-containing protein [Phycisphaerales bacterium]
MRHPADEEWMAYLYGEVERSTAARLEGHLRECSRCEGEVSRWRSVMSVLDEWRLPEPARGPRGAGNLRAAAFRWAVAAAVLIGVGYIAASVARRPDVGRLRAVLASELEPVIRQNVLEQVNRELQSALAADNARDRERLERVKEELTSQYQRETNELAANMLAASGMVTNELLKGLILRLDSEQLQERYQLAVALEKIQSDRRRDNEVISGSLMTLADYTAAGLNRTDRNMAALLKLAPDHYPEPNAPGLPGNYNDERSRK